MYAGSLPASNTWTAVWWLRHTYGSMPNNFGGFQIKSTSGAVDVGFAYVNPDHPSNPDWSGVAARSTHPYIGSYGESWSSQGPGWLPQNTWSFNWLKFETTEFTYSINGITVGPQAKGGGTVSDSLWTMGTYPANATATQLSASQGSTAKMKVFTELLDATQLATLQADPPT